jgi:hypothetical protein
VLVEHAALLDHQLVAVVVVPPRPLAHLAQHVLREFGRLHLRRFRVTRPSS